MMKPHRLSRRHIWLGVAVMMGLPAASLCAPSLETAVKATYLYKLAPFVVWPAGANEGRNLNICVVGRDPFGVALDNAVATQTYGEKRFQIVRLSVIERQSPCDIAYIGGSATQSVPAALGVLQGAPVLTVTDNAPTPGIIDFVIQDGRVRFRIDQDAARAGNLTISSKLLSLAVSVKSTEGTVRP